MRLTGRLTGIRYCKGEDGARLLPDYLTQKEKNSMKATGLHRNPARACCGMFYPFKGIIVIFPEVVLISTAPLPSPHI